MNNPTIGKMVTEIFCKLMDRWQVQGYSDQAAIAEAWKLLDDLMKGNPANRADDVASTAEENEIIAEIRGQQRHGRQKYGNGPDDLAHDDDTDNDAWHDYIDDHNQRAKASTPMERRQHLIKVAGLAISAVEAFDRVLAMQILGTEKKDGSSDAAEKQCRHGVPMSKRCNQCTPIQHEPPKKSRFA